MSGPIFSVLHPFSKAFICEQEFSAADNRNFISHQWPRFASTKGGRALQESKPIHDDPGCSVALDAQSHMLQFFKQQQGAVDSCHAKKLLRRSICPSNHRNQASGFPQVLLMTSHLVRDGLNKGNQNLSQTQVQLTRLYIQIRDQLIQDIIKVAVPQDS